MLVIRFNKNIRLLTFINLNNFIIAKIVNLKYYIIIIILKIISLVQ